MRLLALVAIVNYADLSPFSPSRLYDLIQEASMKMPIAGNYKGSYLTFKSIDGLVFAIDLLVAGKSRPMYGVQHL